MGVTITYEPVAKGVIRSNTLCTHGGSTCAHIFKVTKNLVVVIFGMKTKNSSLALLKIASTKGKHWVS